MKISDIIDVIENPTGSHNINFQYYKDSGVLDIMDNTFTSLCTVHYGWLAESNITQYSSRYAKFVCIDKAQYGRTGIYTIHTRIKNAESSWDEKNFDLLRAPYGADFEGSFFQHTLIANMEEKDMIAVEKMIAITELVLDSAIDNAKIEFFNLSVIEI